MGDVVYADNAATTEPLRVNLTNTQCWANPSSPHALGLQSKKYLEHARARTAQLLGATNADTIFFTASGTESSNLILQGCKWDVVVTSAMEHDATRKYLISTKKPEIVIVLENDEDGKLLLPITNSLPAHRPSHMKILISLIWANNEIGTIQDVKTLYAIKKSVESWAGPSGKCFLHLDAVQSLGHLPINIDINLNFVDFMSFSAHKFHGPRGVGILYSKSGASILSLQPLLHGGGQERNVRPGTENVEQIVITTRVLEFILNDQLSQRCQYMEKLRAVVLLGLEPFCKTGLVRITGHPTDRLCHHISFCVRDTQKEQIIRELGDKGICISGSSACSTQNTVASHVLTAIRVPVEYLYGAIRISLSIRNSLADVTRIRKELTKILQSKTT